MKIEIIITIENIDKYGNKTMEKQFKANSIVNAFIALLQAQFLAGLGSTISVKDTGGTIRNIYNGNQSYNAMHVNSPAGDTSYGIVVGSGTNAVNINNYQLQTLITNGTGSGQLQYGATVINSTFQIVGSDAYFSFSRTITNNSGTDITVNEIGLIVNQYINSYKFLIDRTLYTMTVPNTGGKTITYTIKATV